MTQILLTVIKSVGNVFAGPVILVVIYAFFVIERLLLLLGKENIALEGVLVILESRALPQRPLRGGGDGGGLVESQ